MTDLERGRALLRDQLLGQVGDLGLLREGLELGRT